MRQSSVGTQMLLTASSVVVVSVVSACVRRAGPGWRRAQMRVVATVQSTAQQVRIARGMIAWRGLAAMPHVRDLAPGMLAQIRDDADRAAEAAG